MSGATRQVLIVGYYGHGNAGDEAILAAMLADLRSLGGDLAFTVAGGDPARLAAGHGVRGISATDVPALVEAVRGSDLVILGGGGLFEDYWESNVEAFLTPAQGGLLGHLAAPVLAGLLGRPLVIYAVGVGPLRTEQGRRLTRIAFGLCRAATVRDPESLDLLRGLGLPQPGGSPIELAADPAFDLAPAAAEEVDRLFSEWGVRPAEPIYGVSLRHWSFGAAPGWEKSVARALDRFLAGVEGRVLFLPFHTGGPGLNEDDPALHRQVWTSLAARERAILVERGLRPAELAGVLGRCRLVLAMRYHAALFTLGAGVPAVALAYDPKVSSLMAGAGVADLSLPPDRWQAEALFDALRRAPDARQALSGFAVTMRPLARRSAELALGALAAGPPELPEPSKFLAELTVDKILSASRQRTELEQLRSELQSRWEDLDDARQDLDGTLKNLDGTRKDLDGTRKDLDGTRKDLDGTRKDLDGTRKDLEDARKDLDRARKNLRRARRDVENARALAEERAGRLGMLEHERDALREQRDLLLAERNDVARRLDEVERTIAWRLVSRFWRLMRILFPEGSRRRGVYRAGRRLAGRLLGMREAPARAVAPAAHAESGGSVSVSGPAEPPPDPRADLLRFEDQVRESGAGRVVAIFSATQLLESEGQRPTQLALTLARRGIPVVFVYWRWWDTEWCPQDRLGDGIVQIPIDVVAQRPEMVTGAFQGLERIALFEFPWPGFFETLATASSAGWITIYDVLDDWEEFHRVGQAIWYDEEFERHMIDATDAVFAINEILAGRIRGLGGAAVEVVGNGLKPGLEVVREPRPLARGEVTVGYFGYLAGAWFDWELIAEAARRRPSWRFYLIGYGGSPEGVRLPETVQLLGKQPQRDLAAYAANWDVAIIPFKPDRLAAGADPIKTYEYLAMGLPVVATGVHPPAGGEAFVTRAEGAEGFVRALESAASRKDHREVAARRAFAASCTWDHRLEALLASVEQGRQRIREKRALFSTRS